MSDNDLKELANPTNCPGCGVVVPPGYPRCPKCHALMPGAPGTAVRKVGVRDLDAGGTAVVRARWPWLAATVGVVVATFVAIVVTMCGDSSPSSPSGDRGAGWGEPGESDEPASDVAELEPTPSAPSAPGADSPGADSPDSDARRRGALQALRRDLDGARLWSQVEADPAEDTTAVIRSRECGEDGLVAIVDEHAGALRSAGVTAVRCEETHGAVVFERAP